MKALDLRKSIQSLLTVASNGDFDTRTWAAYRKASKPVIANIQRALGCTDDGLRGEVTTALLGQLDDMGDAQEWTGKSVTLVVAASIGGLRDGGALHGPLSRTERELAFGGPFKWRASPQAGNRENIIILGDWEAQNIVSVEVPQLHKVPGNFSRMRWNKRAVPQLLALWKAWEDAGLLPLVLSYEGAYVPRLIRGSTSSLSNHAYGSAFDINYFWNQLGATPARRGTKGSVHELVRLAHEHGFYWGGNFTRLDGMHFEVCKILS